MKRWILPLFLALAALAAAVWFALHKWGSHDKPALYRTVRVERGDITQLVRATGTVQPVKLVQVGTQVNGIVLRLYADFNSRVKAGDVVAQIDPAVYQANLSQAQANLTHSLASVDEARANLLKRFLETARQARISNISEGQSLDDWAKGMGAAAGG